MRFARGPMPERIGSYPIRGVIGAGSMGVVYLAHDPELDRPVAIKTIQRSLLDAGGGVGAARRFRVEARAAARLAHPGIVAVHRLAEDESCAYIVMEYVQGHSLADYLGQADPLTRDEALCLMFQLLDALHYAHEHGVVHRDIKPANLMVNVAGRLKIADFGIARTDATQFTRANTVVGSPGYMAPEQYTGGPLDRRVDVFAAGVLLYQMLAGAKPFTGTDEGIMYQIVYGRHVPLALRTGDRSLEPYDGVLERALAKVPDDRFASARDLLGALKSLSDGPVPERLPVERILPLGTPMAEAMNLAPEADGPGADAPTAVVPMASTATVIVPGLKAKSPPQPSPPPSSASGLQTKLSPGPGVAPTDLELPVSPAARPPAPSQWPPSATRLEDGFAASRPATEPPMSGWDLAELAHIERELMRHVGPMARVLIKRAARENADPAVVREVVAANIVDPEARAGFLSAMGRAGHASAPRSRSGDFASSFGGGMSGPSAEMPVTAEDVARVSAVLARSLGPIARVLVKRCADRAGTRQRLMVLLMEQLAGHADVSITEAELWRCLKP